MRRFPVKEDVTRIDKEMVRFQGHVGTEVLWFAFDKETTDVDNVDNVYDEESSTIDLAWHEPFPVPVMQAVRTEGPEATSDTGFYSLDSIHLTVAYDQARKYGLLDLELKSANRLHDRFVYDNVVFGVDNIQVRGQLQDRDLIVGITGTEIAPEELRNSVDFERWAPVT